MKKLHITLVCVLICSSLFSQQTPQERLGYSKNTILLIIHADDLGVSHSENSASIKAMEKGSVSSASILVPCPWFPEIAAYAKTHPQADLGIHLALTSEWKNYKWGAVTSHDKVTSLMDDHGFFYDNNADVTKNINVEEAKMELKSQIDRAIQFGIDITHLDSHMGTVVGNPQLVKYYLSLGDEYKVPVLMTENIMQAQKQSLTDYKGILLDRVIIASPNDFREGMAKFYTNALKSLEPGLHCLLLHAAHDDAEMQAVTIDHPDYGAAWRQQDLNFFSSPECKKILEHKKIKVITWREIRDTLYR